MPVMKQLNLGGTTYDTVGEASVTRVVTTGTKIATITIDGTSSDLYAPSGSSVDPATSAPLMDGTAAVGTATKYAREDHVHPTDTSRQAALVSGTNIKTVNNESLLGSGNITIDGGTALTTQEIEAAVDAAFPSTTMTIYVTAVYPVGTGGTTVTVTLYGNGVSTGDTLTFTAAGTQSFTALDDGSVYTITATPSMGTATISGNAADGFTVTLNHGSND